MMESDIHAQWPFAFFFPSSVYLLSKEDGGLVALLLPAATASWGMVRLGSNRFLQDVHENVSKDNGETGFTRSEGSRGACVVMTNMSGRATLSTDGFAFPSEVADDCWPLRGTEN